MTQKDIIEYGTLRIIPKTIDISAYKMILSSNSSFFKALGITGFRVIVGVVFNLVVTTGLAYSLSKKYLPGRTLFITMIFITMIFNGGLIPTYMVVKGLSLTNSIWVLVIIPLVNSYNFIIMKTFFSKIPASLEESAEIDGANVFQILIRVVLPTSMPIIVTMALFYGVAHWNAWFDAAIYISDYKKMPLQIILRDIIIQQSIDRAGQSLSTIDRNVRKPPTQAFRSAMIVLSAIPVIVIYPFAQKYFVKGVMIGAIKG
jgi:putative aldouronate transport system permease protein